MKDFIKIRYFNENVEEIMTIVTQNEIVFLSELIAEKNIKESILDWPVEIKKIILDRYIEMNKRD